MVLAEMLQGQYDNINQESFDIRLLAPEALRHERRHATITRVTLPAFGDRVFYRQDYLKEDPTKVSGQWLYVLSPDHGEKAVRMKAYALQGDVAARSLNADIDPSKLASVSLKDASTSPGCDILWVREAGQFSGRTKDKACTRGAAAIDASMLLSDTGLWQQEGALTASGAPSAHDKERGYDKLSRAREFECYADIPGVSGGRDIPFKRYDKLKTHDKGGNIHFEAMVENQPKTISITLRNVEWPMNNEKDTFTRNSLVMYVSEKTGEKYGRSSYGWGEPRSERLGLNLGWILVNCYTESRQSAKPTFN